MDRKIQAGEYKHGDTDRKGAACRDEEGTGVRGEKAACRFLRLGQDSVRVPSLF